MNTTKLKFILPTLLLSACSLGLYSEPLYNMPDGKTVYQATCRGAYRSLDDCYKLAGQQCMGNFEIINQASEVTGTMDSFNGSFNPITTYQSFNGGYSSQSLINRTLIYRCK